jgi:hypothetical protein
MLGLDRRLAVIIGIAGVVLGVAQARTPTSDAPVSFKKQVLPIFEQHCNMCHAPGGVGYIAVDLDLRTYKGLMSGSVAGVAIVPYHPDRSPFMRVLVDAWHSPYENALKMPPLGPQLSAGELDKISRWIKQGAKDN